MRALVVYESMFGNTHLVAEAVGAGLGEGFDVTVVPVSAATADALDGVALLVVGGPTHVHGMSSTRSRADAVRRAGSGAGLVLDPDAVGEGLRDWFDTLAPAPGTAAAAFDTRVDGPALLTGSASHGVARRLRRHGYEVLGSESFLVDKTTHLVPGEIARAQAWGEALAAKLTTV
jgi:hypothetical protein